MKNSGLFSELFLDSIEEEVQPSDESKGRLIALSQGWQNRKAAKPNTLWKSFIEPALGNLGFAVQSQPIAGGLFRLFDDFKFQNCIALLYLVDPGEDIRDESVARFWPAKLVTALRERKLNWGILTDGAIWRLYSVKSAKPYEDHVELDLANALECENETVYALFERFFHVESFVPLERADFEEQKAAHLKRLGLKAKTQSRSADNDANGDSEIRSEEAKERAAGIYLCRLDLYTELSEAILDFRVKAPLLAQIDNVLRFICNGFIADTKRTGSAYTEEERREVFESSVKLLYRCLFLFYAESRRFLPSLDSQADTERYEPYSIHTLCEKARKLHWNERSAPAAGGYDLWRQLKGLFQAINEGDASYGVMCYNGGLFDDEEEPFLGRHQLRNDFLAPALYGLAFVDPANGEKDDEYPIPYEDLQVRHLGEMYESMLEFKVRLADTDYVRRRVKNSWQTLSAAGQKVQKTDILIKAGDIFFGETALERKQSGSYYTPESLVRFLVGKAVIAPLRERWQSEYSKRFSAFLEQARTGYSASVRRGAVRSAQELVTQFVEKEVLPYKVCDPAMGSGHFLVAAANAMADMVVELLGNIEPAATSADSDGKGSPNYWRRPITRHCLYGVDLNPLAVNLAKLSLWLNCFEREHKLTLLDHHLRQGNSLIGLRDLAALKELPTRRKQSRDAKEEAARSVPGLAIDFCPALKKRLSEASRSIAEIPNVAEDDTVRQRKVFEKATCQLLHDFGPRADLHTAYLMDGGIRPNDYARLLDHFAFKKPEETMSQSLRELWGRVCTLRDRHHFFHWALEFPDVFDEGKEGFSATVGNPPWDSIEVQTLEFYTEFDPLFRTYGKQEAIRVANRLKEDPAIAERWRDYEALISKQLEYFSQPKTLPAVGTGHLNTYKLFLNISLVILRNGGRIALLVPSGICNDEGCKPLRLFLFEHTKLESIYSFENRWPEVFNGVHNSFKFATICAEKGGSTTNFRCAFMQHDPARLTFIEQSASTVTIDSIRKFSPDTLSLMEFPSPMAVQIVSKLYDSNPLLSEWVSGAWNCRLSQELNMTTNSDLFQTDKIGFPLYEGKMISAFDHQFAEPTYWVIEGDARGFESRGFWAPSKKFGKYPKRLDLDEYRTAFRRVAASTNERSLLSTVLPREVISPNTMTIVRRRVPLSHNGTPIEMMSSAETVFLTTVFNSFVCDYLIRLKITTDLSMSFVYTLPIPRLGRGDVKDIAYFWPIVSRALRLICTAKEHAALWAEVYPQPPRAALADMRTAPDSYGLAHEHILRETMASSAPSLTASWTANCGLHSRNVKRRDTGDRAQTRAEIDALVAHLYGITREEFAYILDTFPVLRRKEVVAFGEYQSKRKALEEYDRLQKEGYGAASVNSVSALPVKPARASRTLIHR